ncbi:hypothetical protein CKN86_06170 [Carnobacterium divergens]|uniref:hypothetical protein n=1 Tax=Carnobacterium divergens TaxID=2748 RepID=UPI000D439BA4|nr:hypothetical protein [Carnobacterium divergens]MCO6017045.1 hypothetical protein [Carnobacterium divergens]TFI62423.1 hypothetical protein CKN62_06205 [Carnobacterium divergens]TFI89625.1 hypothetical protein CKN84_06205 [Carnobacterium divergens]TFJ04680.1 hypothetical protein CKN86_06170 [Carnobacterium divergens]TFJ06170.1 hypothetical protein CKN65_06210 [Carnobacterium divergens]
MIDAVKESLADIRKELEKKLIQTFVASQSHATSENRKQMMNQMEKEKKSGLKSTSSNYLSSFKTSAKGQWVKQAEQTFKQTTEQFDDL